MLDDSDFDYVLRLDRNVYEDKALFQEEKNKFLQYFSNYISCLAKIILAKTKLYFSSSRFFKVLNLSSIASSDE